MATLNLKNFPDQLYERLRRQAEREHRSIARHVTHLLEKSVTRSSATSLKSLRGLGKEIWESIDAEDYIRRKRDSWRERDDWHAIRAQDS